MYCKTVPSRSMKYKSYKTNNNSFHNKRRSYKASNNANDVSLYPRSLLQESEIGHVTYMCSNQKRKVQRGDFYGIQIVDPDDSFDTYPVRYNTYNNVIDILLNQSNALPSQSGP